MILLHGWGFDRHIWDAFTPFLKTNVQCLDLLGFGDNPRNKTALDLDLLVEDVLSKAPAQAIYCGWSLGGLVAMKIALDFPDRMTGLITIGSSPRFLETQDWPGMAKTTLEQFSTSLEQHYRKTLEQFILLQFQDTDTPRALIRQLKKTLSRQPDTQALQDGLRILKETDLRDRLHEIQCPQHYLFGRLDRLVPAEVITPMKALTSPNANYTVLQKTGHAAFLSQPTQCAELIKTVIQA